MNVSSACLRYSFAMLLMLSSLFSQATTLKLAIGVEPTEGFDPLMGWSHGSSVLLHSPLLRQQADLSWAPLLAASYQLNEDQLTWTITLKSDLKFSDDTPLTAQDVAFSYNQAAKSGGKADMGSFKHALALDETTVQIQLNQPESTFIHILGSLGIVPETHYHNNFSQNPIGAGPYKLIDFQPGQQMILEQNPHYVGHKNDFNRLVLLFLDQDSAYATANSGQLDLIRVSPTVASQPVRNMKLWSQKSVENRGIMFPVIPAGQTNDDGIPIGNDITADRAIRQAINYAVNRQLLAEQLFEGFATPAFSAVEGLPWSHPEASFKDGNLEKARQLLQEAGWETKTVNGVREKAGVPAKLTLWYAAGDSSRRDLAQAVSAMLKSVGIQVTLRSGSWETVEKHMHSNPTLFGWGSLNPMELYHHYASQLQGVGYFNPGYYANTVVDQYLQQAISAASWQEALTHWQYVEWDGENGVGIKGDSAWAWLLNINHTYLVNPCVDLGKSAPEAHGDWTILNSLDQWRWTCQE